MKQVIQRRVVVPYAPSKIYELVNDIESYPSFLPWCKAVEVHERLANSVKATLFLVKGPLKYAITTHNQLQVNQSISLQLLKGPFKQLQGMWTFEPKDELACTIGFNMQFEFANAWLARLIDPIFGPIAYSLMDAFCEEANSRYGVRL